MRCLDHLLDHRTAFGVVAFKQSFAGAAAHSKIQFPSQIPDVVQTCVHPLSAKWTVYVRRVSRDKHSSHAQLGHLPMVNPEVAAPNEAARFNAGRAALAKHLPYK